MTSRYSPAVLGANSSRSVFVTARGAKAAGSSAGVIEAAAAASICAGSSTPSATHVPTIRAWVAGDEPTGLRLPTPFVPGIAF